MFAVLPVWGVEPPQIGTWRLCPSWPSPTQLPKMAWSSAGSGLCAKARDSQEAAGQCTGAEVGGPAVGAVYRPTILREWREWSAGQPPAPECPHLSLGKTRHPALPPHPFFVLVSGTKSGVGQGSRWACGPKPGHLSPPGMTKPQWRGLCLWPQLTPFWDPVWPQPTCPVCSGPDLPGCILATGP